MNVVEVATPTETADLAVPFSVRLAARRSTRVSALRDQALRRESARQERRAYIRRTASELTWLKGARLSHGPDVVLVDLSEGGALLDADIPLKPGTQLVLELDGEGGQHLKIPLFVLRAHVAKFLGAVMIYRGACAFEAPVNLSALALLSPSSGSRPPAAFAGVDVAVVHLLERLGAAASRSSTEGGALSPGEVLQVLESLRTRMLSSPGDGYRCGVADVLAGVLPELHRGTSPDAIAPIIEERVNRQHPGGAYAMIPSLVLARETQTRLVHTAGLMKELVQRLHDAGAHPSRTDAGAPEEIAAPASDLVVPPSGGQVSTAWQKIVVRYSDGRLLKGFTQDFHPSREQFSLWPSIVASRNDRVIVPFSRLKAVFFVRDFNDNAAYVEHEGNESLAKSGRRVEVTFADSEVVRGTTLSYSPEGVGFFVTPTDPRSNNQRIFVVSTALTRVRFP